MGSSRGAAVPVTNSVSQAFQDFPQPQDMEQTMSINRRALMAVALAAGLLSVVPAFAGGAADRI